MQRASLCQTSGYRYNVLIYHCVTHQVIHTSITVTYQVTRTACITLSHIRPNVQCVSLSHLLSGHSYNMSLSLSHIRLLVQCITVIRSLVMCISLSHIRSHVLHVSRHTSGHSYTYVSLSHIRTLVRHVSLSHIRSSIQHVITDLPCNTSSQENFPLKGASKCKSSK